MSNKKGEYSFSAEPRCKRLHLALDPEQRHHLQEQPQELNSNETLGHWFDEHLERHEFIRRHRQYHKT